MEYEPDKKYESIAPPPIIGRPPRQAPPSPSPSTGMSEKDLDETEMMLGARLLPRVGAGLVLMGLAFFVYWAYTNGYISQQIAFLAEMAGSMIFIALGFALRKTKEQFGEILKAIGCGGLFMTCAAGHLYHHLYNEQAMVGSCMMVSLASMAYSVSTRSKSFYAIGLFGGIVTSLLPLQSNQIATSEMLNAVVMISALIAAAKNRWLMATGLCWIAIFSIQAFYLFSGSDAWVLKTAYFEGLSLISLAAYAWSYEDGTQWDPKAQMPFAISVLTAITAFIYQGGPSGSMHVSILAVGILAIAGLFRNREMLRNNLALSAATVMVAVAPLGLPTWQGPALQVVLAFILLGTAIKIKSVVPAWLAYADLGLAALMSLVRDNQITTMQHVALASTMLIAMGLHSLAFAQAQRPASGVHTLNAIFGALLATRIGMVLDSSVDRFGMPVTIAWTAYSLLILVIGVAAARRELRLAGIFGLLGVLVKVMLVDLSAVQLIAKVAILISLGLAMLVGGYLVIRSKERNGHAS